MYPGVIAECGKESIEVDLLVVNGGDLTGAECPELPSQG
jgi:hypothetical protein